MNIKSNNNKIPEEALKLLPWYATGWLSPEERIYVKEVLSEYPELQELLLTEREMIRLIKEDPELLDLSVLEPTEVRLDKVLEQLAVDIKKDNKHPASQGFITSLSQYVRSLFTGDTSKTQYAAFAAITTLSIALLFAFISPLVKQNNTFYPATAETSEKESAEKVTILLVGLNAEPNDPRLLKVLQEVHANMSAVPGKDGMYRVNLPEKLDSNQTKALLQKLSDDKELFWFAGEAY